MIEDIRAQAVAATSTTAAGLGTFFDYLPDALGVIATLSGITLTWVMIYKGRLGAKKNRLEIEVLEKQLEKSHES
jgi:hypothetical protein